MGGSTGPGSSFEQEKTTKFDLDWVRFITELSDQYPQFGVYDFIKRDKEINPTLANLILLIFSIPFKLFMESMISFWR